MKTNHYYVISLGIFLLGAAFFSIYVYKNYVALNEYLVPIDMPGEGTIKIDAPGEYDFYYEIENGGENLLDEDNSIPDFAIKIKGEDGRYIAVIKSPTAKKYEYMKRVGVSIYSIKPTEAGMYEVSGNFTNNNKSFQLKFDRGFSQKRSVTVVNAQALFLFPIIVSLILFLYAYSRDRL